MRNYKFLKSTIIILALIIVGVFVTFYFVVNGIKNKNQNIAKLQNERAGHLNDGRYLESMKNIVNQFSSSISQIESSIVSKDGDVAIIETIEQIGQKNNLELSVDSISEEDLPSTKDSGITTLKISARTSGSWKSIYNFVSELEALPYKVKIQRLSFSTSVDNTKSTERKWQNVFEIKLLKYK